MIHRIINDKRLIISVAPRAGHHTITDLINAIISDDLQRNVQRPVMEILQRADYLKVKFVRNPYHRVVGSYYIVCGNPELELYKHCFGLSKQDAFELTFRQFLSILDDKDLSSIDFHIAYQKIREESVHFKYDEVYKIETLLDDIDKISTRLGISLVRPVQLGNTSRKILFQEKSYDLPFIELLRRFPGKSLPEYTSFYNEEIKKHVYDLYKVDIDSNHYDLDLLNISLDKCTKDPRSPKPVIKESQTLAMIPDDFDWAQYVANYLDLQKAGIDTKEKAEWHWKVRGCLERRKYKQLT